MRDTHDSVPDKFPTTWDAILSLANQWKAEDAKAFYRHIVEAIDNYYNSAFINADRPETSSIQRQFAIVALVQALAVVEKNIPQKDRSASPMILRETMELMTTVLGLQLNISPIAEKWEKPAPGASFPIGNIRKQIDGLLRLK